MVTRCHMAIKLTWLYLIIVNDTTLIVLQDRNNLSFNSHIQLHIRKIKSSKYGHDEVLHYFTRNTFQSLGFLTEIKSGHKKSQATMDIAILITETKSGSTVQISFLEFP